MNKIKELKRSNYWIQTYTNGQYDFMYNNPEDVNIVDIARSLSQQVRFTGHSQRPLSVAQHCLTVSASLAKDGYSKEEQFIGLLHDSHEAYIGDLSSPFKRYLKDVHDVDVEKIEEKIKNSIGEKFGIDLINLPECVKKYDLVVLRTEASSLFTRCVNDWHKNVSDLKMKRSINTILGVNESYILFMKTFNELNDKLNPKINNNGTK